MAGFMRKDWDYVTFTDYKRDMADLTDRAISISQYYQQEVALRERLIYALIKAVGGKIVVNTEHMIGKPKGELVCEANYEDRTRIYMVKE